MTIFYSDVVSETLPATDTELYTCPTAALSAHIIFANVTNTTGVAATIDVNLVQSGESVASTNLYIDGKTVVANGTDGLTGIVGAVLKPGDIISAIAGTASALNLKIGVKEIY